MKIINLVEKAAKRLPSVKNSVNNARIRFASSKDDTFERTTPDAVQNVNNYFASDSLKPDVNYNENILKQVQTEEIRPLPNKITKKSNPLTEEEKKELKTYLASLEYNGKPRFSDDGICDIVSEVKTKEGFETVKLLADAKDSDGKPKFDGIDILIIAENVKTKEGFEAIKWLINLKDSDGESRFRAFSIAQLAECLQERAGFETVKYLSNDEFRYRPWIEAHHIKELAKLVQTEEDLNSIKFLTNLKGSDGTRIFTWNDIIELAKVVKTEEEFEVIKWLSNIKNSEGEPRFEAGDIAQLVRAVKKKTDFETVTWLMDAKKPNGEPRFNAYEIRDIAKLVQTKEDFEAIKWLVNFKRSNDAPILSEISDKILFSSYEIGTLAETVKTEEGREAVKLLANYFNAFDVKKAMRDHSLEFIKSIIENADSLELDLHKICVIFNCKNEPSIEKIQKLKDRLGRRWKKIEYFDFVFALDFSNFCGKTNPSEVLRHDRKILLRKLVSSGKNLFNISNDLKKLFPILPKNQKEYCSLLPKIVRSLGIETKELSPEQIQRFNQATKDLAKELATISDKDFAGLKITQEYSKEAFIADTLKMTESLSPEECQKVYDYFGFELLKNNDVSIGYSITGYPANLNNGEKLAQIKDPNTKAVIEAFRPFVKRFSEQNPIHCENERVANFLNEIVEALPELRTIIGKKQHETHDFDVLQHSLKVMQKIAQDERFQKLNNSDQKVMLLTALLHDITKAEGKKSPHHAATGSFDSFFIAKKINLTREEEIKLHTLINSHEWLAYVNDRRITSDEQTKRLQSVAFDLQQDHLFDMAEIFTHADLRAVKVNDSFHDTKGYANRRSFGESADAYASKIRKYIQNLKKTQPLLPQTQIPKASRIEKAITQVNADGSTNIKGVYKDKDGLIVIKYNEVEDWEAIGFPKGSVSRGIKAGKDIDTGNIKFFVHGLEYANQLANFDAFSMPGSDVLISASYAERVDSKNRFFRPQGIILDVDPEYVYGGGQTDSGSGYGKDIKVFKNNYIFGGAREGDRKFVSDLIKKATGMNDQEYVDFYEKNKGKGFTEIEPAELRETIIKALATMHSITREGGREYNEMYISNPKRIQAVFAYNMNYKKNIDNPIKFLNRKLVGLYEETSVKKRTEFLRQYALEHNIPFIVFGD